MHAQEVVERPRRPVWARKLDEREQRFVTQYLVDLNATQAVLRAGITDNIVSAGSLGWQLRQKAHVVEAIDRAMSTESAGVRQSVIQRLHDIVTANIDDFCEWRDDIRGMVVRKGSEIPVSKRSLIKKLKVKSRRERGSEATIETVEIELHDPIRAAEVLTRFPVVAGIDAAKVSESPLDQIIYAGMKIGREQAEAAFARREIERTGNVIEGECSVVEPEAITP